MKNISTKDNTTDTIINKEASNNTQPITINIKQDLSKQFEPNNSFTSITFCGGLEEVGKNMSCIRAGDEIYIIDCGMKMLKYDEYGYRIIIPSFDYVLKFAKHIRGLIITHGHEDHIGAIPFLLRRFPNLTIYLPNIAREILRRKLKEYKDINIKNIKLVIINENFVLRTPEFEFSFYVTVHSIPDSYGIIAKTSNGTVVFSGDFRVDFTPLGKITEFHKLTALQDQCDLFLSDSTNSLVNVFSTSERVIINNIEDIFRKTKGRLIVTAFASNVFRVQNIIRLAIKYKRKIFVIGRSMKNIAAIALRQKYFDFQDSKNLFLQTKLIDKHPPSKVIILCTGSQGEPLAALTRMSEMKHSSLKILTTDTIVFSSNAIPGNYWQVEMTVNNLQKFGASIIRSTSTQPIHTSGHASREEQKLFLALLKPKAFVPIHGELNMLVEHVKTAIKMGVLQKNTFICKNGSSLALQKNQVFRLPSQVPTLCSYVDGCNLIPEDKNRVILNTRRVLIRSGIVFIVAAVNISKWCLVSNVSAIVRGTFYSKNNMRLIINLQQSITELIRNYFKKERPPNMHDSGIMKNLRDIINSTSKQYIFRFKRINPYTRSIILTEQ